jgi:membrane-anchored protein YejM (alkaline phosphatase superfamily)
MDSWQKNNKYMEQIIGNYKEYVIIERKELDKIEQEANLKLNNHKGEPMSEASIEARSVLDVLEWLKENNIYNRDFHIKG